MLLKRGARPRAFTATEDFAVHRVAFAWRARFAVLGPVSLRVLDSYDGANGRLEVRLLGIPIQRRAGPELAQGEAFRYLAEIAWVPQAMLANSQLTWRELDDHTVEVATTVRDERIAVRLIFDESGDLARTIAERPRLEADNMATTWIGEYAEYRQLGGIRLPTYGEVRWELSDGPFVYWRARITSVCLDP